MQRGIRSLASCALAASLGGCAIPGAVTVTGYAADGASFLLTGKSASDHALSLAMDRDCALLRVTMNEPICRESEKNRREVREARDAAMTAYVDAADEVAMGQVVLIGPSPAAVAAAWPPPDAGVADAAPALTRRPAPP
jgi:fatty acid/phospholipid biosynthesis enzyme